MLQLLFLILIFPIWIVPITWFLQWPIFFGRKKNVHTRYVWLSNRCCEIYYHKSAQRLPDRSIIEDWREEALHPMWCIKCLILLLERMIYICMGWTYTLTDPLKFFMRFTPNEDDFLKTTDWLADIDLDKTNYPVRHKVYCLGSLHIFYSHEIHSKS